MIQGGAWTQRGPVIWLSAGTSGFLEMELMIDSSCVPGAHHSRAQRLATESPVLSITRSRGA